MAYGQANLQGYCNLNTTFNILILHWGTLVDDRFDFCYIERNAGYLFKPYAIHLDNPIHQTQAQLPPRYEKGPAHATAHHQHAPTIEHTLKQPTFEIPPRLQDLHPPQITNFGKRRRGKLLCGNSLASL